ncbi:MAG: cation transporter [Saprospiraceae bacterium]|nr:cation transporter [Saprospiraceae bacterium]
MRNIIVLVFALGMSLQMSAQSRDTIRATVDGMGCPFCANGLEKAFRNVEGIRQFNIDLEGGTMQFLVPSETNYTPEQVVKTVDKAGYTATKVSIHRANGKIDEYKPAAAVTASAEKYKESIFPVAGNCGMCKTRIESAVNELPGIFFAFWNQETQKLHVRFDESKISQLQIEQKVASVGHDTPNVKADKDVYEKLHECCQYDRKGEK